jgi:phosphatidylglycerol:prolipoprotein diacylglycerol transferase
MHPVLIKFGPLTIYSYGFMVAIAFFCGIMVTLYYAKKEKIDKEKILDLAVYVLIASIVGARLLYVIGQWDQYQQNLLEIVMLQKGGLVVIGGIIGAIIVTYYFAQKHKIAFLKLFDLCTPGTILGLGIGRIGCFLNGCCFGLPTNTCCSVTFPVGALADSYYHGLPLHPTQLYDFFMLLAAFVALVIIYRQKQYNGQIFFWGLLLYAIARFIVESFRYSPMHFMNLTPSQWMVLGFALVAVIALLKNAKKA